MWPQFFAFVESTHSGAPPENCVQHFIKERWRVAALTPAYQKKCVSPLNQQTQDFLEERAKSEKSEIMNGAGQVFAFVRSLT